MILKNMNTNKMSVEDLIKNHNKVELLEMCEAEK